MKKLNFGQKEATKMSVHMFKNKINANQIIERVQSNACVFCGKQGGQAENLIDIGTFFSELFLSCESCLQHKVQQSF